MLSPPIALQSAVKLSAFTVVAKGLTLATHAVGQMRSRRDLGRVSGLSDAQLHDIGLTRQDVYSAQGLPAGRDPTFWLAERAEERRRNP